MSLGFRDGITNDDLRAIQPAFTHNWDIEFPPYGIGGLNASSVPMPSQIVRHALGGITHEGSADFFPAISCEYNLFNTNDKSFKTGNISLSIPTDESSNTVIVAFLDGQERLLVRWLQNWSKNGVLNGNKGTSLLADCVKQMFIHELGTDKEIINTQRYWVYPVGQFPVRYTSSPDILMYSQTFKIAGDLNEALSSLATSF